MPLSEREQKILDEIERQFEVEDPELTQAVAEYAAFTQRWIRLSVLGALVGLLWMLSTFYFNQLVALFGFGLMVVSVSTLITVLRRSALGSSRLSGKKWGSSQRNMPRFFRR